MTRTNAATAPFDVPYILSNAKVQTIISYYFGPLIPAAEFPFRVILADEAYLAVSPEWVRNCILNDPVLVPQNYQNNVFDCDDYVQHVKTRMSLYAAACRLAAPLAVGYLFTKVHAFSFCINPARELFLIDTQSDAKAITHDATAFPAFLTWSPGNPITHIYI